jgi:4-carboxymuconolactone decarboxylase
MALLPYADEDPQGERVEALLERLPQPRINLFRMLANMPALAGPTLRLGEAILTKGELNYVLRELTILQTARLTNTEYEWVQHEAISRVIGIEEEKIRAVDEGRIDDGPFDDRERLALHLAASVLDSGTPPPELVERAAAELGRAQAMELMIVAGYYAMLAGMMRAVQLDVDNVLEKGMLEPERLTGSQ